MTPEENFSPALVSVVVPTHARPELVRRAIDSILAQDHPGEIEVIVVFDRAEPDESLRRTAPGRTVEVITNTRTPGLAGARNSGILASRGSLVAFLDDDDWWRPTKLRRQVEEYDAELNRTGVAPHLVTCSIAVDFEGRITPRTAGTTRVTLGDLTRSRMSMLHSSGLLFDRAALLDHIGLVDEEVPGSQNEDWDLLLRSVKVGDIVHVDEALVVVTWGAASFFTRTWDTKISSLHWMMERHPEIEQDRKGAGRVYGQISFGEASRPDRRAAVRWAGKALVKDPLQWRAYVGLAVAARLLTPAQVLNLLHKAGRGV
ncbi:glycosyltransferase family 2 protein [Nocardioides gilvus]|uniref:glycosyltransferase family 2 protein n=1 Tax=Nocardioides gilvus TaxID=1735589 RepID=UPI000D74BF5B|nr:glycosyltransferase family 2 protein [Nocardioides gilvus]